MQSKQVVGGQRPGVDFVQLSCHFVVGENTHAGLSGAFCLNDTVSISTGKKIIDQFCIGLDSKSKFL